MDLLIADILPFELDIPAELHLKHGLCSGVKGCLNFLIQVFLTALRLSVS